MMTQHQYMERTIQLAKDSIANGGACPCAAIVVKDGQVISESSCRAFEEKNPLRHAEIVAIELALKKLGQPDLQNCEIYASSEPCPMCLAAIYWVKLKTVYFANTISTGAKYGLEDQFIYAEAARKPAARTIPFIHLPEHDATEPFKHWKPHA